MCTQATGRRFVLASSDAPMVLTKGVARIVSRLVYGDRARGSGESDSARVPLLTKCIISKLWDFKILVPAGMFSASVPESLFPQGFYTMTHLDHVQFLPSPVYIYFVYFYCSLNYPHGDINSRMHKWAPWWFPHHVLYDNIAHECYLQVSRQRQTCGWSKFVGQQHSDICFQFVCMFLLLFSLLYGCINCYQKSLQNDWATQQWNVAD